MAGLTLFDVQRDIHKYKAEQNYRQGIVQLTGILEEHGRRQGFLAWVFDNREALEKLLRELKQLRIEQCLALARERICVSAQGREPQYQPLVPANRAAYADAVKLLEEAEGYWTSDDPRFLLSIARPALKDIDRLAQGRRHLADHCLKSAKACLAEMETRSDEAADLMVGLREDLQRCRTLADEIKKRIGQGRFSEARAQLQQLRECNREDAAHDRLLEQIDAAERLQAQLEAIRARMRQGRTDALAAAYGELERAGRLAQAFEQGKVLLQPVRVELAERYFEFGCRQRDASKNLSGALKAFGRAIACRPEHTAAAAALKALKTVEQRIVADYNRGVECLNRNQPDRALKHFDAARQHGFAYEDLDGKRQETRALLDRCRRLLNEAQALIGPDPARCELAMKKIQQVRADFPDHADLDILQEQASRHMKCAELLAQAQAALAADPAVPLDALRSAGQLLAIDPKHAQALEIQTQALALARDEVGRQAEALAAKKCYTQAVKRLGEANERLREADSSFSLGTALEARLDEWKAAEDRARRMYQDGIQQMNAARNTGPLNLREKIALYEKAEAKFRQGRELNLDIKPTVRSDLETLGSEKRQWLDYERAKLHLEAGEIQQCCDVLAGHQATARFDEITALYTEAMNRLGFAGGFRLQVKGHTYRVLPCGRVLMGRNTERYRENHIALKLPDVSRRHGVFAREDRRWTYANRRGCTHGTALNGQLIDRPALLRDNDVLGCGYFLGENDQPTGEEAVTRVRVRIFDSHKAPTVSLRCEPSDHREFAEDVNTTHCLMGVELTIGRGRSCAVRIDDPTLAVEHLRIHRQKGSYQLQDLGSPTGSFVNGQPLDKPRVLRLGDRIKLGRVQFQIEPLSGAGAESSPRQTRD